MGSNSPPNHGCRRHRCNGTLSLAFPCPFSNGSNKTGEELPYVSDFYPSAGSFNCDQTEEGSFPCQFICNIFQAATLKGLLPFAHCSSLSPRFLLLHLHTQRPFGCMALPACKVDAPSNSAVPSGKFGLFSVGADAQGTSTNFCLLGTTSSLSAISRDILLELL